MSKKVIIAGCGVAGPVLGMLLKRQGFLPVIYERQQLDAGGGVALALSSQSLKVLDILGLARNAIALGRPLEQSKTWSQTRNAVIAEGDSLGKMKAVLGWPMVLLSRPRYTRFLVDAAMSRGIEVHHGMPLAGVAQDGQEVVATFADGTTRRADLLIGADGLHSVVRAALFGAAPAQYMGYVQVSGFAPMPSFLQGKPATTTQYFADGGHFMVAPLGADEVLWVWTTTQEAEEREDWRYLPLDETRKLLAALPAAAWDNGPAEVLASATSAIKYPLFERPLADVWHKGRVVLVGDAAHPTSPFLGQGANQAMEDCYHLVRLLTAAGPLTDESIDAAFAKYESLRAPITKKSTAMAKLEGTRRVVHGREAAEARDEAIAAGGGAHPDRAKLMMELLKGPFEGESEI